VSALARADLRLFLDRQGARRQAVAQQQVPVSQRQLHHRARRGGGPSWRGELAWWIARRVPGQNSPELVGALIADPTVYERLVTILDGAQRSFLLRTMIRSLGKDGDPKASKNGKE
jgi:hypothetical protein